MASQPWNLALRFFLEIAALVALGRWGFRNGVGAIGYVLAIVVPLAAATLWGVFAVPGDPSRSGNAPVPVPGMVRLALELAFFACGAAALGSTDGRQIAVGFAAIVIAHYALSWDRIGWLLTR